MMKAKEKNQKSRKQWPFSQLIRLCIMVAASLNFQMLIYAVGKTFTHPGIYQTREDLDYMKQQVLRGKQPWKDAFERIKASISMVSDSSPMPEKR